MTQSPDQEPSRPTTPPSEPSTPPGAAAGPPPPPPGGGEDRHSHGELPPAGQDLPEGPGAQRPYAKHTWQPPVWTSAPQGAPVTGPDGQPLPPAPGQIAEPALSGGATPSGSPASHDDAAHEAASHEGYWAPGNANAAPGDDAAGDLGAVPRAEAPGRHRTDGRDPRAGVSWSRLVAATAATALLASFGTAAFTGAFSGDDSGTSTTSSTTRAASVNLASDSTGWEDVAETVRASVVALDVQTASGSGAGSGVIIDADGDILTNAHVVEGAQNVTVTLSDGRVFEATVVGSDAATDLAVVRLTDPPEDLQPAELGTSSDLVVGQAVLAVGNPLGLDSTATTGIISALDRPVITTSSSGTPGSVSEPAVTSAIQVDAAINPGNSGGPLFNSAGQVIGITSSIATLSGSSSSGSIGLGFAIPVDQAANVADQLITTGEVEHAFLGVGLDDATATVDGVTRRGAVIRSVQANSPAAQAGLQEGDVVIGFGDSAVNSAASLTAFVRQERAGGDQVLEVVRDGQLIEVEVTLASRAVAV